MKYKIEILYQTGDSFHSEDTSDILDCSWESLEVAKENLQRIKDHNEFITSMESWFIRDELNELIEKASIQEWYVEPHHGSHISICLKLDDGTPYIISAFWNNGYFESLNAAQIIIDDKDLSFEA